GGQGESPSVVIEIEFLRAVVVRKIDVGPRVAVEVGRRSCQRPSRAADAHFVGHVLELAATKIVEEQVLPTVSGELEAVVHDLRGLEVPQVDVASKVRGDIEVEQTVAIVVEPDRAVAVYAAAEARLLGYILETSAPWAGSIHVLEQREIAVAIHQHVLAAVVVEVAPNRAHRNAL